MNFENSKHEVFTPLAFEKKLLEEIMNGFLVENPEWAIFCQHNITVEDVYHVLTLWLFFSDSLHMNFKMPSFSESSQNKLFWKSFIDFIEVQDFAPLTDIDKEHILQVILAKAS